MPKKDATKAGCKPPSKTKGHKPAHNNTFAFQHNANSKITKRILALPNEGLCRRCTEKIEWRKKYRKYKPLTKPAVCVYCKKKEVKAAYHKCCLPCASEKGQCPFCVLTWEEIEAADAELAAAAAENPKVAPVKNLVAQQGAAGPGNGSAVVACGQGGSEAGGECVEGSVGCEGEHESSDEDEELSSSDEESDDGDDEFGDEDGDGGYDREAYEKRLDAKAEAKWTAKLAANGGVDWSKYVKKLRAKKSSGGGDGGEEGGGEEGGVRYTSSLCLEVQAPFASALVSGRKTVETRAYPLPPKLWHVPLRILETSYEKEDSSLQQQPQQSAASKAPPPPADEESATAAPAETSQQQQQMGLPSFVPEGCSPAGGARTNWTGWKFGDARTLPKMHLVKSHAVVFGGCKAYESRAEFEAQRVQHCIEPGSAFDSWQCTDDDGPLYAWEVEAVLPLEEGSAPTTTASAQEAAVPPAPPLPLGAEGSVVGEGIEGLAVSTTTPNPPVVATETSSKDLPCLQRKLRSIFHLSWPSLETGKASAYEDNPFASYRTLKAEAVAKQKKELAELEERSGGGGGADTVAAPATATGAVRKAKALGAARAPGRSGPLVLGAHMR